MDNDRMTRWENIGFDLFHLFLNYFCVPAVRHNARQLLYIGNDVFLKARGASVQQPVSSDSYYQL